ncbi:hypothetical protein ACS0TY_029540 [Phlomoides rotata]
MEDYILGSKIVESSSSTVWKAERRTTGEAVVLKQIPAAKLGGHLRNCLECEVSFLSSVNHPNIIRLLDFFKCEGYIILVLEFCSGGNLASFIRRHGRVQECIAKRFMQQLGAGLKVLKQHHIVHRDLKPENVLLSGSECNFILKITDFGLSRILPPNESAETVCGSPFYMAPEILQFQRYDEKLLRNIKESTSLPFSRLILPQLHPDCVDLCLRLLSINPDDRLSYEEFCQHNFLQESEFAVNAIDIAVKELIAS